MNRYSVTDFTGIALITGLLAGLVAAAWLVVVLVKGRGCEETEPEVLFV